MSKAFVALNLNCGLPEGSMAAWAHEVDSIEDLEA